ncbi:MAG: protein kinase domain-containing protein [Gemmataceae bacterium]
MANPKLDEAAIFNAARQIEAQDARRAYLDQACGDDAELRLRLDRLLHVHDENLTFLEKPAEDIPTAPNDRFPEGPGSEFGPYQLLEKIGEGGFGKVFMAVQRRPIRRTVALKILKPGMDTFQVIARFEAERQALALMDHPNIGRVLDGGETASGRPYFVMELVRGVPITRYCNDHKLTPRERLVLFADVCAAVQHAHQKGIIHRDIKPSNVLVTEMDGRPIPKLIDFGVAKALGQNLTENSLFTPMGAILGTLEYMSPEQAEFNALDIDTRADIYSLGVVLYELLTGTTPLTHERIKKSAMTEALRLVREENPPKPSMRLSDLRNTLASISAQRKLEPAQLTREIRGDLDWIVMKALEKDRNRRYSTPGNLAEDVERYLRREAILARPPSATYRMKKFAQRNRGAVLAGAAVAMALVVGTTVATWEAFVAINANHQALLSAAAEKTAKEKAEEKEAETRAVLDFVESKVFAAARPEGIPGGLGSNVSLRQSVEAALPAVAESFPTQPLIEARLRLTLGTSFHYLGDDRTAGDQFRRARAIYAERLSPTDARTLKCMSEQANALAGLSDYSAAFQLHKETLALRRATLGPNHRETLKSMADLATCYAEMGQSQKAVEFDEETLALRTANLGPDDPDTLDSRNNLALSYAEVRRYDDALKLQEDTLALFKAKFGPSHPSTLKSMINVAKALGDLDRHADAVLMLKESLAIQRAKLPPDHPFVLQTVYSLALRNHSLKRYDQSLKFHTEAFALRKAKFGPDHRDTLFSMWGVAVNLLILDRGPEAIPIIDECLQRAAAGKPVDPRFSGLADKRLQYFEKLKDPVGCRVTAEIWEKMHCTDVDSFYNAARYRAVAAAVYKSAKNPGADAARLAAEQADQAMAWLQKAIGAGFKDKTKLQEDKDLDALRDRDDFKRLLADLGA